jgi:hypothetical protein
MTFSNIPATPTHVRKEARIFILTAMQGALIHNNMRLAKISEKEEPLVSLLLYYFSAKIILLRYISDGSRK